MDLPIACTLGQDCYIETFFDTDPGPGRADHTCGFRTRDGHRGIDFAVRSFEALESGVDVRAAAPGVVAATRDGVAGQPPYERFTGENACGNGVRIKHEGGLQTLYCHLDAGSIGVAQGQTVEAGQTIGRIGLSGLTNFPHLHFAVLSKEGRPVDPFGPEQAEGTCGAPDVSYWNDPPTYQPTGFFTAGFTDAVPGFDSVKSGDARRTSVTKTDAIVLYAHMFLAQHGDLVEYDIQGPGGVAFSHSEILKAPRKNLMRAFGRKAPKAGWPKGRYTGAITLTRKGRFLGKRYAYVIVE
ncbi:M23 family metallopeptidase [Pacificoceanicola onchidii]|uniref:M23 family metallopeptidase n=1 Tax=Pacificoceanicola onchidii TaxID=2562685 RepID=UPI001F0F3736|nr:M23 family metallopeptidase [Pacificoceanicola onchidii]